MKAVDSLSESLRDDSSTPRYRAKNSTGGGKLSSDDSSATVGNSSTMRPYCVRLAGVTHNNVDGSSRQRIILTLKRDQELRLVREPKNPFDSNAISVHTLDGRQIGYVERERAVRLAHSMDKGVPSRSFVQYVGRGEISGVRVRVLREKTELPRVDPRSEYPMSGTAFLTKYYADEARQKAPLPVQAKSRVAGLALLAAAALCAIVLLLHGC